MTHSMTAFARVQNQLGTCLLCWEIKSVNHRYLDISFRLPESFRFLEMSLRQLLRTEINRGKLECQLKIEDMATGGQSIVINGALVNTLLEVGAELASHHHIANDLTVSQVLAWPGVIHDKMYDEDAARLQITELFQEALMQLLAARHAEGCMLKKHIQKRVQLLHEEITSARAEVALISGQTRAKLLTRLQSLQMSVEEGRFEQEMALMLARMDVSEELDRLETHLFEVQRTLEGDDAAGRRLDFLMQELNREANTLSSKSDSVELTQHAVQMKVLIEQMREQIQNIE